MSSSYQTSFPALKYNPAHRMLLVTALMFFLKSGNETIVLVYMYTMLMMYINDHIIILYALMMIIFPSSCKPIVYFIAMFVLVVMV